MFRFDKKPSLKKMFRARAEFTQNYILRYTRYLPSKHSALKATQRVAMDDIYLLASDNSIELTTMRNLVMEGWTGKAPYPYLPAWFVFFVAWCLETIGRVTGNPAIVTRKNIDSTVWDRQFSIAKTKRELGYSPKVSFREGIVETVNWFKKST